MGYYFLLQSQPDKDDDFEIVATRFDDVPVYDNLDHHFPAAAAKTEGDDEDNEHHYYGDEEESDDDQEEEDDNDNEEKAPPVTWKNVISSNKPTAAVEATNITEAAEIQS